MEDTYKKIKLEHETYEIIFAEVVTRLENTVDLLSLGIGKAKALKELREDIRTEDEDLRDYVTKVINKLDKIASSL